MISGFKLRAQQSGVDPGSLETACGKERCWVLKRGQRTQVGTLGK